MIVGVNSEGHNYNTYKHQVQLAYLVSQTRDAAYVLKSTGFDATCGLVCCTNSAIVCSQSPFLPEALTGIISHAEYNELCASLNKVFVATVLPMIPCFCFHLCIPFSPMCAVFYYQAQRRNGVTRVLEDFNKRVLHNRGAYFEPINQLDYIAQLKVDRARHQQYLLSVGGGQIAYPSAPLQQQQQVIPAGYVPVSQGPAMGYGGAVVPVQQQGQYVALTPYPPAGGFSGNTVVPMPTAQYVQPVGVVPMSIEQR